jgi:hypothetical protein
MTTPRGKLRQCTLLGKRKSLAYLVMYGYSYEIGLEFESHSSNDASQCRSLLQIILRAYLKKCNCKLASAELVPGVHQTA